MIKISTDIKTKLKRYNYYRVWIFQRRGADYIYRAHNLNANQSDSDILKDFEDLKEHYKTASIKDATRSLTPDELDHFINKFCRKDFVIFAGEEEC
ncbi:hypothetical protein [Xylocopilactobacillus apis]|uniref:Phage protein n=1 Tax=Xylocopilactobacillus apis TaxID=2932183 RepID=A0AAU9D051_9LACO|nr:hypothetical protein [Xylocopilactobacillus apis]BDR56908.1 hypothetical protein KIMC2_14700 [Xylocopilactobacillus apis]